MDIETIKTLIDIRDVTYKFRVNVQILFFGTQHPGSYFRIHHPDLNKEWRLYFREEIETYFPYDGEFVDWLNHKIENIEFEKEMQRYLNLKAFI